MDGGNFDWRTLGKADYSQAAALVASLPEEHRGKLVNGVREVLVRIVHLGWQQAGRSGTGAAYCWPSEAWLAKAIGRSDRTVRRCLVVLSQAGLISYRRRATKGGAWTSNLYQVGKTFMASLFARGKKKVQSFRDRTKMSTNDLKREYKAVATPDVSDKARELMEKYRANHPALGRAPQDGSAYAVFDAAPSVQERKALLKKQAEYLIARGD